MSIYHHLIKSIYKEHFYFVFRLIKDLKKLSNIIENRKTENIDEAMNDICKSIEKLLDSMDKGRSELIRNY